MAVAIILIIVLYPSVRERPDCDERARWVGNGLACGDAFICLFSQPFLGLPSGVAWCVDWKFLCRRHVTGRDLELAYIVSEGRDTMPRSLFAVDV